MRGKAGGQVIAWFDKYMSKFENDHFDGDLCLNIRLRAAELHAVNVEIR